MQNPKIMLDKSLLRWLLEEENPSICYFTLRDLLDRNECSSEVQAAKAAIPASETVAKIFSKQNPEGFWEDPTSPYIPKYKASYWQIMVLGCLGMDKTDERIVRACEHVFQLQLGEGGFSCQTRKTALREYEWKQKQGRKLLPQEEWIENLVFEQQLSCLTGNVAAALIRLGYEDDRRVQKALWWLLKIQNVDGGWLCPYWKAHVKDKHGCFHGTICSLEAFSEISEKNRTSEMQQAIEKGAEFLLIHRLFKADHHGYRVINRSWLELGFPYFYRYSILRGLDVLTKLGYVEDRRIDDALQTLLEKRRRDGKWTLENTPISRMQADLEKKGKPSKWITLTALKILKRLDRLNIET